MTPTAAERALGVVFRTADALHRRMAAALAPHGLTGQQYNVLRILRGAGPDGIPTLEVAERMVEQSPGVTRLLDRLEEKALVRRERGDSDRRLVRCFLTPDGLALLGRLDGPMRDATARGFAPLDDAGLAQVAALLERVLAEPAERIEPAEPAIP